MRLALHRRHSPPKRMPVATASSAASLACPRSVQTGSQLGETLRLATAMPGVLLQVGM